MTDGLMEAVTIFAATARAVGLELVVNNSQFQGGPDDPAFRDLRYAPSFLICSIGSPTEFSIGRRLGPFIFKRHPTTKTYAHWSAAAWPNKIPLSCPGAMATRSFRSRAPKTWPGSPQLF